MQGKIGKILWWRDCRTVTIEKDSEVPRRRVLVALLSTEDSNDSQKSKRAVLTIHPTLAYLFFSLIRPLLLRVLPKGGWITKGLL